MHIRYCLKTLMEWILHDMELYHVIGTESKWAAKPQQPLLGSCAIWSEQRLLMWARFNPITPAVLAGGDLYRIHSFSAFHIPPHCCQDDGLNHLCAEGARSRAWTVAARTKLLVWLSAVFIRIRRGHISRRTVPLLISECLLPQMPLIDPADWCRLHL